MVLKLNISQRGKSWRLEFEPEILVGKSIGDIIRGEDLKSELNGYELQIRGGSDFAGFPMSKDIEGIGLKRLLLTKGWGMRSKPRGLKKKALRMPKGLRLRKTVRGKTISDKVVQVNLAVIKEGAKPLVEIFTDQNKQKEQTQQIKQEKPVEPHKKS